MVAGAIPSILFISDNVGRCHYVNERFAELTGMPTSDALGFGYRAVIDSDDLAKLAREQSRQGKEAATEVEIRLRNRDGGYSWFLVRWTPVGGINGPVTQWFGVATDIDRLKKSESALRESNDKFSAILSSIDDCFFTLDADLRIVEANDQAARWVGSTRQELLGRYFGDVYPIGQSEQSLRRTLERKESRHYERPSLAHPGRWIEIRTYPSPQGVSVLFTEITGRKESERLLRESNERIAGILASISDCFFTVDKELRIVEINEQAAQWVGRTRQEVVGRCFGDIFPTGQPEPALRRILETNEPDHFERRSLAHPDKWISIRFYPSARGISVLFHDITERKRSEEAVRETSEKLAGILASVSDGFWVLDRDWKIMEVNDSAAKWVCKPRSELMGRTFHELFPHPRLQEAVRGAFASGKTTRHEVQSLLYPGRWLEVHANPSPYGVNILFRDITSRRNAEQALRETNEKLAGILSSISDCFFTLDSAWNITEVNDRAAQWIGHPRHEVLGRKLHEVFPDARSNEAIQRAFVDKRPTRHELPSVLQPGRWIEIYSYPSPLGVNVLFHDVTDRKNAEAARHEVQELLSSAIDALPAQVAIVDSRGIIVAVNAAWRRFVGCSGLADPNHGIGTDYFAVCEQASISTPEAAHITAGLRAVMSGELPAFRAEYRCDDGAADRWSQIRISRFGHGPDVRLVVAHEDITEMKQAEESLRRLAGQVLRSQDDERRRIARELHDSTAQTLVGATLNLARLRQMASASDPAVVGVVEEAQALVEQSLRELRTVSYLLHPPALEEAGLAVVLRWYAQGFTQRSDILVDLDIADDVPRLEEEMETALFRVVQECLTNVHRHSGSAAARIRLARQGGSICLEVADNGKGMDVDPDDPESFGRLGVGIPGMRLRMRQLGGMLHIISSPRGTTVRATLPGPSRPEST